MTRQTALAVVVVLTVAGFALRLHRLGVVPLRGDEAFAAQNWAGLPLADSLRNIATIEPHPPLTYVLFRSWGLLVGINEFTLRLLPALINLMGIPAIYALGHRLRGRQVGLLAALLWTVNPYQIWHAQDARNYAIWAGLSLVAVWLGLRVIDKRRSIDWVLYALVAVVTVFTFYLELFMLVVLSLYAVVVRWRDKRFLRNWLLLQAIIVTSIVMTFWILQGHLFVSGGYGGTLVRFDAKLWLTWFLPTLTFGATLPSSFVGALWPLVTVVLAVGLVVVWKQNRQRAIFLGLLGGIPLLLLGIAALRINVFHPRYVIVAAPAFALLFAELILWVGSRGALLLVRRSGLVALVGGWMVVTVFSLSNYFYVNDYTKSANWPPLTRYLRDNVDPRDLVIQTSVDAAFGYYYDAPAVDTGLPANPQETRDDILATLVKSRDTYRSIWIVGRTFADWPNAGIVEQWAQENMQRVRSTSAGGLPIQQFMTWEVHPDETQKTSLAAFANVAELIGVHVFTPPEPTGELTIWLYWRPLRTTEEPLKIFLHLTGNTNPATGTPLWTQKDQFPQGGRTSTTSWSVGETYRDVYTLPISTVPPGSYNLVVGFYNPVTNQRVPVGDGDSYIIEQINLP